MSLLAPATGNYEFQIRTVRWKGGWLSSVMTMVYVYMSGEKGLESNQNYLRCMGSSTRIFGALDSHASKSALESFETSAFENLPALLNFREAPWYR